MQNHGLFTIRKEDEGAVESAATIEEACTRCGRLIGWSILSPDTARKTSTPSTTVIKTSTGSIEMTERPGLNH